VRGGLDDRLGPRPRVFALEDARADEHCLGAELHHQRRVGWCRDAAGTEQRHRQAAGLGDLLHQPERRLQLLGPVEQLSAIGLGDLADIAGDGPQVTHCLDDVAGAGLALGANHAGPLGDAPQRFAQVGGAAHERHRERPLVDVMCLVRGGQHLRLVDVVDIEGFEHLGLAEVADPGLGHDRNRHGRLDALDHRRVAHAGHTAVTADVGRHAFERHHGDRAGILRDLGLLGRDDIHDDAAPEHVGKPALDPHRSDQMRRSVT